MTIRDFCITMMTSKKKIDPPIHSFLFRDKLPNSNNRFEIIMFLIALLALYNLNKSINQLRTISQNQQTNNKHKKKSQPIF